MRIGFSVSFDISPRSKCPSNRGCEPETVQAETGLVDIVRREDARSTPFLKSVFDDFAKRLESKRIVRISEERWPIGISLWLIIELLIGGIGIEGIARADDISQVMYVSGGASITILFSSRSITYLLPSSDDFEVSERSLPRAWPIVLRPCRFP